MCPREPLATTAKEMWNGNHMPGPPILPSLRSMHGAHACKLCDCLSELCRALLIHRFFPCHWFLRRLLEGCGDVLLGEISCRLVIDCLARTIPVSLVRGQTPGFASSYSCCLPPWSPPSARGAARSDNQLGALWLLSRFEWLCW